MASKRKHTVVTLEKNLPVIAEVRNGKPKRLVADTLGIPKSTVGDIWKEKEKIKAHVSASSNPSYAKKHCIVWACTFRSSTIFLSKFLSCGHCPVPWCPNEGDFTTYTYIYLYIHSLYRSIYIHIHTCILYVYVCICMYMYVYVCICMYMYVYVCICMYMYVYVCICMYMYVYVCICMYMYVYVCILHSLIAITKLPFHGLPIIPTSTASFTCSP